MRVIEILGIGRHDRLRTLLSSYVDGEVSPAEAARVESHLSGCDECQRDLDNMRATVGLLGAMPELELPRSFLLTAEPEPVHRNWTIPWGGALATAAAAAVFLALIAGGMTGVFEQTGLDARGDAASIAVTAPEAEMAVAADTAAAPVTASAAEAPVSAFAVETEVTLESAQVEGSDDSASDAADAGEVVAAVAAPAPVAATSDEPAAESAVVDESIDVEEALAKDIPVSDDESAAAPAPALTAEAPVSSDDSLASDDAEPQQLTFGTTDDDLAAGDGEASGNGAEDDTAISLPLWQLQIATGALLALVLAATIGLMMRRRRAL
jgi:anti-sigma factor RsiW